MAREIPIDFLPLVKYHHTLITYIIIVGSHTLATHPAIPLKYTMSSLPDDRSQAGCSPSSRGFIHTELSPKNMTSLGPNGSQRSEPYK